MEKSKRSLHTLSNTYDIVAPLPLSLIGCDWLSLSFTGIIYFFENFDFEKIEKKTPMFKEFYEIYYKKQKIGHFLAKPRMKTIRANALIFKFENYVLYSSNFHEILQKLCSEKHIKFSHVVRIDLYTDFQRLLNDNNPQTFIKKFLSNEISKVNKAKFQLNSKTSDKIQYQSLSFGRYSSRLVYKIYNKTKELQEVKSKEYIIDNWKKANFIENRDTWRIEFCIANKNINAIDDNTAELLQFDLNTLFNDEIINEILKAMFQKYFSFKKVREGITKEYWKKYELTDVINNNYKIIRSEGNKDNTRADRIFLRKLMREEKNLILQRSADALTYSAIIDEFATRKGLNSYYMKIKDKI